MNLRDLDNKVAMELYGDDPEVLECIELSEKMKKKYNGKKKEYETLSEEGSNLHKEIRQMLMECIAENNNVGLGKKTVNKQKY